MTNPASNKERVAGGAGYALAGRLGALIEAASFIVFTWFYGATTFGLYAVLWSYVKVSSAICEVAMTTALQRYIPKAKKADEGAITGYALKLTIITSSFAALCFSYAAPYLSNFLNTSEADAENLTAVIRLYTWVLPFWCVVNVATAAVRATRTFGPEVKVRIFYEQGLRLVSATVFALMGFLAFGLFAAHLLSIFLSAILALRLLAKHYDLRTVFFAPITGLHANEMLKYGSSVMPAYLIKMLFSEFPVMFLNMLLPGATGAAAGGFYSVARKIASALQAIHKTFEYVMAPLAAEKDGSGDHKALTDMFAYATRLSLCVALPFAAALIWARHDILAAMPPEFHAASLAIVILCTGRVFEAATGPSAVIVEMTAHHLLPTLNGLLGFATLIILGSIWIPIHGVTGAALAAAIGLNVTAYISLTQAIARHQLNPYTRELVRPLLVSLFLAALILSLSLTLSSWAAPSGFVFSVSSLVVSIGILIRYGLSESDSVPFGKIGRVLRLRTRH